MKPYKQLRMESKAISAPSSKQRSFAIGAPQFNGGKPIIIRHREYLQNLVTVNAFTGAGRYILQPGLTDNFPWLGQIAGAFENYRFRDIRYVYRNRIATNSAVTVYTATQYDVTDPEFKSVDEIMTYKGARSEVGWRDFAVDCKVHGGQLTKKYLVRTDAVTSDVHLYDAALFTICAVSGTAGQYAGDLLVEYTVELWNPKMNPNLLGAMGLWAAPTFASVATWAAGPLVGVNSFITANSSDYFSTVTKPVVDEGKSEITFPIPGTYDVMYTAALNGTGEAGIQWTNTDGKSTVKGQTVTASDPGQFVISSLKVVTTVAGAVLKIAAVLPAGTSAPFVGYLTIAVEAANFVLDYITTAPGPMQGRLHLENFKKAYPKYDVSKWEAWLHEREWKQEIKEQLNLRIEGPLERKLHKPAEEDKQRQQNQSRAEDSDGDIVESAPEPAPAVTPVTPLKDPFRSGSKSRK